ncbi:ATP-dependent helicase HrpB [Sedimenticola hydrogenitrophicus]|uniref:ATP-dependent helicase HrpB n=1 Tax=Sedimenticola hydrogenitrophicus TaxID=2967975 RepID=UPI0021A2A9C9|nr:ATP-dependent helicase HrpB [Sedimenticola hydrogenitrophicus]
MSQLPVTQLLPELCRTLAESGRALVAAPPGSGKTTLIPLELIRQPWLAGQKILMLEPRRLATRAAARRMAQLLGEPVGQQVGYQVRFEREISANTRIEVVTEGILTRRLQQDPELRGVGLIIFDEFHERSLHADLALALTLDVMNNLRDDLRLLVMSATLDTGAVAGLLGGAPVIVGEGRSHPVELRYLERPATADISESLARGVLRAVAETAGDILAFLPGSGEIRRAASLLKERLPPGVALFPLYGDLSRADQDAALTPLAAGRRVVLATSIAETSLTIEGIGAVVDAGWSRRPRFDPNSGLSRLQTVRVSAASAEQRAGRAGRLGPGVCYRLWTVAEQARLIPHQPPELLEADLAPLVLELALWGVTSADGLAWLDGPPAGAYAQARELLQRLDALDAQGRITALGRRMVGLALHPRLAHLLLNAGGQVDLALDLAALLNERDILRRRPGVTHSIDIEERLHRLAAWRQGRRERAAEGGLDRSVAQQVERSVKQWRRLLGSDSERGRNDQQLSVGGLLSLAFPERIAQRRTGSDGRYLLASGRGVVLSEGDPLSGSEYLVVAALDAGRREGRAYLAAPITLDEIRAIQAPQIGSGRRVAWESASHSVVAREEERLGSLILSLRPLNRIDQDESARAMLTGIRQMGLGALPWNEALLQWRQRVMSLRSWLDDPVWPDLSDAALLDSLEEWLAPWLTGISRREHLKQLDLDAILHSQLSWEQQQQLEKLAPASLTMPSGGRRRLHYQAAEPPVLAVRLQELFGLRQTPAVCRGTVYVMLHLLSPAQRPIQITQDLAGFWDRTYAEVRKELKGRYPKHYWPDDPCSAVPTARVRPVNKG